MDPSIPPVTAEYSSILGTKKTLQSEPLFDLRARATMYPGEEDKDVATEPALDSPIGDARRQVISIKKQLNVFLTEEMEKEKTQSTTVNESNGVDDEVSEQDEE